MTDFGPLDEAPFWEAVIQCLVAFHGIAREDAERFAADYLKRLETADPRLRTVILHDEPFNVACDITGKQLDIGSALERYAKILQSVA
jgi:hypothetical protein